MDNTREKSKLPVHVNRKAPNWPAMVSWKEKEFSQSENVIIPHQQRSFIEQKRCNSLTKESGKSDSYQIVKTNYMIDTNFQQDFKLTRPAASRESKEWLRGNFPSPNPVENDEVKMLSKQSEGNKTEMKLNNKQSAEAGNEMKLNKQFVGSGRLMRQCDRCKMLFQTYHSCSISTVGSGCDIETNNKNTAYTKQSRLLPKAMRMSRETNENIKPL
mmetsp:Transcript_28290/g.28580  ORF Transcript_28290/g.28580 Transcript_28290/m.28580 type:complete len:215 (-) Transcript_28290:25-669(-)